MFMNVLKPFAAALTILLCLGVFSCSEDDENYSISELYGIWELTHSKGWEIYDGVKESWDGEVEDYDEFRRIEFLEDNTYNSYEYSPSKGRWVLETDGSGTYEVKGNKIYFIEDYDGYSFESTINSLNSSQLKMEYSDKGTDDGIKYEYYEVMTLIRVNESY